MLYILYQNPTETKINENTTWLFPHHTTSTDTILRALLNGMYWLKVDTAYDIDKARLLKAVQ